MPFRCIIHLPKHNVIGEAVAGNRRKAIYLAYFDVIAKQTPDAEGVHDSYAFTRALYRAEQVAYASITGKVLDCVTHDGDEYSFLIERCDAPLTQQVTP